MGLASGKRLVPLGLSLLVQVLLPDLCILFLEFLHLPLHLCKSLLLDLLLSRELGVNLLHLAVNCLDETHGGPLGGAQVRLGRLLRRRSPKPLVIAA